MKAKLARHSERLGSWSESRPHRAGGFVFAPGPAKLMGGGVVPVTATGLQWVRIAPTQITFMVGGAGSNSGERLDRPSTAHKLLKGVRDGF